MYEDEVWKPIEAAKSLKEAFIVNYLEIDTDFDLSVYDFNHSMIDLKMNFTGNPSDHPEYCDLTPGGYHCNFKIKIKDGDHEFEYETEYELDEGLVTQTEELRFGLMPLTRTFKFGGNSTTITLRSANSEIMDDTQTALSFQTSSYGTSTTMTIGDEGVNRQYGYIKFNLSTLPRNLLVQNAVLWLNCTNEVNADKQVLAVQIYSNSTWNETYLTWANQSAILNLGQNLSYSPIISAPGWYYWNVTAGVKWEDEHAGFNNVSFKLYEPDNIVQYDVFGTKEDTDNMPFLNITYIITPYPYWSNNFTDAITVYSDTESFFNITWQIGDNYNISTVLIESNYSGTAQNYSMYNHTSIWIYNITLPAGRHYWKSHANATIDALWNSSDKFDFFVNRTTNKCHLNFSVGGVITNDSDLGITSDDSVSTLGYCDSNIATLYYNGGAVGNPHVATHGVGTQQYVVNSTGNQNYTLNAAGTNFNLTVSQSGGGGGGGGGEDVVIVVSGGNFTIKITNDRGGTSYILYMKAGSQRERLILISSQNLTSEVSLELTCEGTACPWISLNETIVLIPLSGVQEKEVLFSVDVPSTAQNGNYYFAIIGSVGTNTAKLNGKIMVTPLGVIFNFLDSITRDSLQLGRVMVPNWIILLCLIGVFLVVFKLVNTASNPTIAFITALTIFVVGGVGLGIFI